jgi:hypothetical protein
MINGVFPRVCTSFREGGFTHAEFIFTTAGAAPVILLATEKGNLVQPTVAAARAGQVVLARTGVGLYTLTLKDGARQASLVQGIYLNKAGVVANALRIEVVTQVRSTGVFNLVFLNSAGAAAEAVTANDEAHFTILSDK